MTVKKTHKKPAPKQAPLFGEKPEEHLEPAHPDENLALIVDKKVLRPIHKSHIASRLYGIRKDAQGYGSEEARAGPGRAST